MSVGERDKYTGHMTTGHEWNGIKELNTPIPLVLVVFLTAAFLFAVGYWIFMPAWPLGDTYTKGTLGFDQRQHLAQQIEKDLSDQSSWMDPLEQLDFDSIRNNTQLMAIINESGPALFEDNCAMCHGNNGDGGRFFPKLNDSSWLWGSDPNSILKTLEVGINSTHPDTRFALMPAFGATGVLDASTIDNLVVFLQSRVATNSSPSTTISNTGAATYAMYCAGCHGEDGTGNTNIGGPNLIDAYWIYGGDEMALKTTLHDGRKGHMPAWENRLTLGERKILTFYVLSLVNATDAENKP